MQRIPLCVVIHNSFCLDSVDSTVYSSIYSSSIIFSPACESWNVILAKGDRRLPYSHIRTGDLKIIINTGDLLIFLRRVLHYTVLYCKVQQ